ncbi:MAG: metal ABC transporter ATP-binding protein [Aquificae bacterium]|nr:metal ABC transporter ATP-binding protein [Aquificota bacterium]
MVDTEIVLKIENLKYQIGDKVILEDINLEVKRGEFVAIVGPNGGGKTTLIKLCLGLLKPTAGRILLLGTEPREAVKTGKVGYLPQKMKIPKDFPFSVLDVVLLGLIRKKLPKAEKVKIALKYLKEVKMEEYANHPYSKLSGGQQQRVSLARALASEPVILFLDEPSTGVDVVAQESLYTFLKQLKEEKRMSIVMVSHDIGVIGRFVDKVAGLNRYLHYYDTPQNLLTTQNGMLKCLYGEDVEVVIHSPECATCEHFHIDGQHK